MSDDEWAYLREGFNWRSLRKEDLRRIFATHNVPYTNDMLKPQLLELYHSSIAPRRAELRAQYVDVVPSGLNIVDAASNSESDNVDPQPPRSPRRLRPRTRSPSPPPPRRQRSPRRVASGGKTKPQPPLETVPDLAPKPEPEPPLSPRAARAARAPRSPRRVANRKVELPGLETEAPPQPEVPLDEIKIKAPPRSPRRRGGDDDDSFSNENVFQPARKRASHGPESAPKRSAKTSHEPASSRAVPKIQPEPSFAGAPLEQSQLPSLQQSFQDPQGPSPDALLLDEALVDALNAEVQWEQAQDSTSQHAADLRMMLDLVNSDPDFSRNATEDVMAQLNSEYAAEPVLEPKREVERSPEPEDVPEPLDDSPEEALGEVPSSDIFEGSASELSQRPPQGQQRPASVSPDRTPAPSRRRGFIPSFSELSVSRAFTEQLEPYMVASPATTPKPQQPPAQPNDQAIPVPRLQKKSPTAESTPDAEVIDPEAEAAQALHDVVEGPLPHLPHLPRPHLPHLPRPHLPHLPRPHLPHLPRPRLPRLNLPRPRMPRIPRPHLPRWRLPMPRLPRVRVPRPHLRLPRLQLPRLPRVHVPRPRLPRVRLPRPHVSVPRPRLPQIKINIASIMQRLLQGLLSILGVLVILSATTATLWYRGALSKAEFCNVGATAPHTYPDWTLVETSSEVLGTLQNTVRDAMDAVWPECIPCPAHAQCYQGRIMFCSSGYREALSPLSFGGLWPVPPRCLPDWEVQRKLEVLGERAAHILRKRRADALCGEGDPDSALAAEELTALLRAQKAPQLSDEEFDFVWQQVLHRLPERYADVEVVRHVDSPSLHDFEPGLTMQTPEHGRTRDSAPKAAAGSNEDEDEEAFTTYLRSRSDALVPLSCRIRLFLVDWVHENRKLLLQISIALVAAATTLVEGWQWHVRRRRLQKRVDKALKVLQDQTAEADAGLARRRYVKTLEFRKGVPKQEWQNLQRAVEGEQGVRVRQIEINGEITRVWEWTG